jgi:N-carbamoylputrescine amidase
MDYAHKQGVQVICFGELFTAPYFALGTDPMWIPMAEDAQDGRTVTELKEAARRFNMVVIAPIYELDPDKKHRFNTAVVIDEKGNHLGKFRKAHIPYGSNEQGAFHENFYYGRSDADNTPCPGNVSEDPLFPVFATSVGHIAVAICYDRHFPYVMWSLARQSAELIFCPSITFGAKSERVWLEEFPTDAARHNIFIGGSNRCGAERPWNQPFFGRTYFVGPNGVLENRSILNSLVISDIDLSSLADPDPSGWNHQRDSRPEWPLEYKRVVQKRGT